jgi:hypothetical protein
MAVLLAAAAGCAADAAATGAPVVPTVPPTTVAVPDRSVPDEVRAAYLRSWTTYARAVGTVDAAGLPAAFAGPALTLREQEVERLRRAGEAVRVRVVNHAEVALVDGETAVVTDTLENHMVRVDAATGRPLEPDPGGQLTRAYTLRREDGTWKVTEAVAL